MDESIKCFTRYCPRCNSTDIMTEKKPDGNSLCQECGFESKTETFILSQMKIHKCSEILKYFEYSHLPEKLKIISQPICELARKMDIDLPDCPEKNAGLRKLLEAKDCFVRAELEANK